MTSVEVAGILTANPAVNISLLIDLKLYFVTRCFHFDVRAANTPIGPVIA